MARKRMLSPSFFTSRTLAACSFPARLLFAGLWTLADRDGRLELIPKLIEGALFPHDEVDFASLIEELVGAGSIIRYGDGNGDYLAIPRWTLWQSPHHKEAESRIPAPNSGGVQRTRVEPGNHEGQNPPCPESESESESESEGARRPALDLVIEDPPKPDPLLSIWAVYREHQTALGMRRGPKPTKDLAQHLRARLKEHEPEEIEAVIRWAHTSTHKRAVYLRDGAYLGATLFRPSNFAGYLALALGEVSRPITDIYDWLHWREADDAEQASDWLLRQYDLSRGQIDAGRLLQLAREDGFPDPGPLNGQLVAWVRERRS